jgi:valyl-tRNA synthetase
MKLALPTVYDPQATEDKWYRFWLDKGFFAPNAGSTAPPFCIVIPPPNVTGSLHIGHALNNTLQDILIRMRRMQGRKTLWVFGTDHAGIATQNVVEKQLAAEGLSRNDLGREEFVKRVWRWKAESGNTIIGQLKKLGVSCDWSRERFTMDDGLSRAVQQVFIRLYNEGLIYRGHYIINWCPRCHTALSDLEVEYHQIDGHLYYLKYPLATGTGFMVVATTRPETMLGDTAVAVHPADSRFTQLVGREVILPIVGRRLPIIADSFVDPEFGTGSVKVTPAHDPYDFEVGLRHQLPQVVVMNPDATMSEQAGKYAGLDRFRCRHEILEELKAGDYIERIEDYQHAVGHCYRCKTIIEPTVSEQWFLKMKPLAKPAIEAVRKGRVKLIPKQWENTYYDWMNNIRDWCISRQIWWGHRIPVWYCQGCNEVIPAAEHPDECHKCGSRELTPETDVLDTWFSSALWPFSTLGWPDWPEPKLKEFYPTSVLVTGFDILFFWVARMIMMGLKFMGEVPFREVYIHALVRDAEGQKMSKSKGNVIDPLETMESYGTDAFRFTLTALTVQGRDICLSEKRIEGYRNFINKIWNASRFCLMNLEGYEAKKPAELKLETVDKWMLEKLGGIICRVTDALEGYEFSAAAVELYHFFWHQFCDWYLELIKPRLYQTEDKSARLTAQNIMVMVLENSLKLLHPIIPFVTEEIWQQLHPGESVMVSKWPEARETTEEFYFAEKRMNKIISVIEEIRRIRTMLNISPAKRVDVYLLTPSQETFNLLKDHSGYIENLGKTKKLVIRQEMKKPAHTATGIVDDVVACVDITDIDLTEEENRLKRNIEKLKKELAPVEKKLANPGFLQKAPPQIVAEQKLKRDKLRDKLAKLEVNLDSIQRLY